MEPEITPGEISRSLKRLEEGQMRLETAVVAFGALSVRVDAHQREIETLKEDVKAVTTKATMAAGGISVLGFLAQFWPGHRG